MWCPVRGVFSARTFFPEPRWQIKGERHADGHWLCFAATCGLPIDTAQLRWLGAEGAGPMDNDYAVPMHVSCAEGPWPLYSLSADDVIIPT